MRIRQLRSGSWLLLTLGTAILIGCAAATGQPAAPTTAPVATAPGTTARAQAGGSVLAAGAPAPKTWAEAFPTGEGREMVLRACGTCHGFDKVVLGQKSAERWEASKAGHAERAGGLSGPELNTVFSYLATHFGPNNPEPDISTLPVTASSAE